MYRERGFTEAEWGPEADDFDCGLAVWLWKESLQDYMVEWWFHEGCGRCDEINEVVTASKLLDDAGLL